MTRRHHRTLPLMLIVALLLAVAFTLPLASIDADPEPTRLAVDKQALVAGNTEFAVDLYETVAGLPANEGKNLFFSPYSISQALAMTYAGARGETAQQMADTLHVTVEGRRLHEAWASLNTQLTTPQERPEWGEEDWTPLRINNANSLWCQERYPIEPDFIALLDEVYQAPARRVDFRHEPDACRQTINEWVEDKTEDKIQDLIPEGAVSAMTRLVLVNAIYFLGQWRNAFDPDDTRDGSFQTYGGGMVVTPMMVQTEDLEYARGDGYQIVELPYNLSECSMAIILPDAGSFDRIESDLDAEWLQDALGEARWEMIDLLMPKFRVEHGMMLRDTLISMGMELPFEGSADFSGINDEVFISEVIHKAFCAVDEAGTEAAAATAVIMDAGGMPSEPIALAIDRPFMFVIRDRETGTILFMGRVLDPTR